MNGSASITQQISRIEQYSNGRHDDATLQGDIAGSCSGTQFQVLIISDAKLNENMLFQNCKFKTLLISDLQGLGILTFDNCEITTIDISNSSKINFFQSYINNLTTSSQNLQNLRFICSQVVFSMKSETCSKELVLLPGYCDPQLMVVAPDIKSVNLFVQELDQQQNLVHEIDIIGIQFIFKTEIDYMRGVAVALLPNFQHFQLYFTETGLFHYQLYSHCNYKLVSQVDQFMVGLVHPVGNEFDGLVSSFCGKSFQVDLFQNTKKKQTFKRVINLNTYIAILSYKSIKPEGVSFPLYPLDVTCSFSFIQVRPHITAISDGDDDLEFHGLCYTKYDDQQLFQSLWLHNQFVQSYMLHLSNKTSFYFNDPLTEQCLTTDLGVVQKCTVKFYNGLTFLGQVVSFVKDLQLNSISFLNGNLSEVNDNMKIGSLHFQKIQLKDQITRLICFFDQLKYKYQVVQQGALIEFVTFVNQVKEGLAFAFYGERTFQRLYYAGLLVLEIDISFGYLNFEYHHTSNCLVVFPKSQKLESIGLQFEISCKCSKIKSVTLSNLQFSMDNIQLWYTNQDMIARLLSIDNNRTLETIYVGGKITQYQCGQYMFEYYQHSNSNLTLSFSNVHGKQQGICYTYNRQNRQLVKEIIDSDVCNSVILQPNETSYDSIKKYRIGNFKLSKYLYSNNYLTKQTNKVIVEGNVQSQMEKETDLIQVDLKQIFIPETSDKSFSTQLLDGQPQVPETSNCTIIPATTKQLQVPAITTKLQFPRLHTNQNFTFTSSSPITVANLQGFSEYTFNSFSYSAPLADKLKYPVIVHSLHLQNFVLSGDFLVKRLFAAQNIKISNVEGEHALSLSGCKLQQLTIINSDATVDLRGAYVERLQVKCIDCCNIVADLTTMVGDVQEEDCYGNWAFAFQCSF